MFQYKLVLIKGFDKRNCFLCTGKTKLNVEKVLAEVALTMNKTLFIYLFKISPLGIQHAHSNEIFIGRGTAEIPL